VVELITVVLVVCRISEDLDSILEHEELFEGGR